MSDELSKTVRRLVADELTELIDEIQGSKLRIGPETEVWVHTQDQIAEWLDYWAGGALV